MCVHFRAGGQGTVNEGRWMHQRVEMCTFQSRRLEYSGGVRMEAPECGYQSRGQWRSEPANTICQIHRKLLIH
jgi:hypothetical protein